MTKQHAGPHKYKREIFKASGTTIYRCGLLGCTHFVYEPLIVGRVSLCWRCGAEFEVIIKTLRAKKFHCEDCTRGRYNKVIERPQVEEDTDKLLDKSYEVNNLGALDAVLDIINEELDKQKEKHD